MDILYRTAFGPSVAKCMQTFACQSMPASLKDEFPSGFLLNNPTMLCYQGNHWVLVVVAMISLLLSLVVVPVYIGWSMYKIGPEGRVLSKPFQRRFGFMFMRYFFIYSLLYACTHLSGRIYLYALDQVSAQCSAGMRRSTGILRSLVRVDSFVTCSSTSSSTITLSFPTSHRCRRWPQCL